jgi:phosphoglycolate phosphatase-like HAD superfamily hydrolase
MNRHVLVFDLDGTLLDARPRQVQAMFEACGTVGEPAPDADRFWQLKRSGLNTKESLERLDLPGLLAEEIACWWQEHIEDPRLLRFDRMLPSAMDAIQSCRQRGLSPRILTARRDVRSVLTQIDECGLRERVDDVQVVSPSAAATEKAEHLRRWRAVAFIGDTESDARASELAMVRFLAVSCGQRSAAFLASRGLTTFDDASCALTSWLNTADVDRELNDLA